MFYEDMDIMGAEGGCFDGSLNAVEMQSAMRNETILRHVDDLLHAPSDDEDQQDADDACKADEALDDDGDVPRFDYDRHCGAGYNAHHDGVDAEEVS